VVYEVQEDLLVSHIHGAIEPSMLAAQLDAATSFGAHRTSPLWLGNLHFPLQIPPILFPVVMPLPAVCCWYKKPCFDDQPEMHHSARAQLLSAACAWYEE